MRFSTIIAPIAFAVSAMAQTFSVATPPSLVQCQPVSLSWTGGTAPYIIAAIPGGQTTAAAISYIAPSVSSSPYTWNVNLPTGLVITIKVTDSTGVSAYSSQLTIQTGASASCLNTSASTSGLSTAAVSSTSAAVGGVSSSAMGSMSSAAASSSASASATSSGAAASVSSVSSAANSAVSAVSAASSLAASATSKSGAFATAVAGIPALAAGAIGVAAALF